MEIENAILKQSDKDKVWLDAGVTENNSLKLSHAKHKICALNICALILTGMSVENKDRIPLP